MASKRKHQKAAGGMAKAAAKIMGSCVSRLRI